MKWFIPVMMLLSLLKAMYHRWKGENEEYMAELMWAAIFAGVGGWS